MTMDVSGTWNPCHAIAASQVLAVGALRTACFVSSRAAVLGDLGYSIELLLGATAAVLGLIGVFLCVGKEHRFLGAAPPDEQFGPLQEDRQASSGEPWEENAEITVRLEHRFLHSFHRRRCIVTIFEPLGSDRRAGREVWYASDDQ